MTVTRTRPLRVGVIGQISAGAELSLRNIDAQVTVIPLRMRLRALSLLKQQDCLLVADSVPLAECLSQLFNVCGFRASTAANAPTISLALVAGRPGAGATPTKPVSIVVTVLNEIDAVDPLINLLKGQLLLSADEIVVVDGGSTDGTSLRLEGLARQDPRLRVISAPGTNISAGRNAGIRIASNNLIACTDAGCVPSADWLLALRVAFEEPSAPGLVASIPRVEGSDPLSRAQALGCYPHPSDAIRPHLGVKAYGKLFGQVFDPRLPFARSIAFTRDAWDRAGGFPEDLSWVEDGVFGANVSLTHPCVQTVDGELVWHQRGTLHGTFMMYRQYGVGAAQSQSAKLFLRDVIRVLAYVASTTAFALAPRRAMIPFALAASGYLSLPISRAVRERAGVSTIILIPFALLTKDVGKVFGGIAGFRQMRHQPPRSASVRL